MATNGTMNGNAVTIYYGGNYYHIDWQLASQNTAGNYSTINWQAGFVFNGDDAQLDNGVADLGGATQWYNGGRVYNYSGNNTSRDLAIASGSFNIGHDSTGNATLNVDGGIDVYQAGRSAGSASWALPTIPRYANITQFYLDAITDASIRSNWAADSYCDYVSWWSTAYDGGTHHDTPVAGSGLFQISISNLKSLASYDMTVAVRRQDSGLWTNSGTLYATTLGQNNFMAFL